MTECSGMVTAYRGMSRVDKAVVMAVVLLASIFPVDLFPGSLPAPRGIDGQYSGKQGQIILIKVPTDDVAASVKGTFLERPVSFFPDSRPDQPVGYVGLLGLDMQDEPGSHELSIEVRNGERSRRLSYSILVIKEKFRVERLTLPKDKVDLDAESLARWKAEQEQVREALATDSQTKLWQASFMEPVNGKRTGVFGSVRILNGQARNPHSGEDIGAPLGEDVSATNDGIVRLTVDHLFSGKGVYLDHGLGLYSMYFHLSEVLVKEGDLVKAGQVVGKVGASGRATGPHLHWSVKLNGARVNPYALLHLPYSAQVPRSDPTGLHDSVSAPSSNRRVSP